MSTTLETGLSYVTYEADAGETVFAIPYSFLEYTHIRVSVNGVGQVLDTEFTVNTSQSQITFLAGSEPNAGDTIVVSRSTPRTLRRTYTGNHVLTSSELTESIQQLIFIIQELQANSDSFFDGGGFGTDPDITIVIPDGADVDDGGSTSINTGVDLSSARLAIFRNGGLVSSDNWELTRDDNGVLSVIVFTPYLQGGDAIDIFNLNAASSVGSLSINSVGSGSLQDDAVTTDKIAEGAIIYEHLKQTPSPFNLADWSSSIENIDDSSSVAAMLFNLHSRLEAQQNRIAVLESDIDTLEGGGSTSSGAQIEVQEYIGDAELGSGFNQNKTVSFGFTPDIVYFSIIAQTLEGSGNSRNVWLRTPGDASVFSVTDDYGSTQNGLVPSSWKSTLDNSSASPISTAVVKDASGSTIVSFSDISLSGSTLTFNWAGNYANASRISRTRLQVTAIKQG